MTTLKYLFRKRLRISSDIIHSQLKDFDFTLTQKDVSNYNEAVKNKTSSFFAKDIHPLFYTKISWQIIENLNKLLDVKIDDKILNTIVHLSEEIHFYKKIKAPANIITKIKIWRIAPHKKGTRMLIKFDYYIDNELIATEFSEGLMFGVKCIGEEQFHEKMPETKIITDPLLWKKSINIEKELPYIYAKKAKIDAPIHTNPKFAKSIGLPNNILQGTCTFAKAIESILDEELDVNSSSITEVSAKFTGMVVLPNQITVRLLKREKNAFYFDVINKENNFVIKGGQIKLK